MKVLVIDDEEAVLRSIRRRLEREGYEVESAENAAEGAKRILEESQPFDAIVTDMSMDAPDSGLRVLHAAFSRDLFAAVIVMTAFGNVNNAVECMRRGAFDYIEKNNPSVDAYELLTEKLNLALDRRRRDARAVQMFDRFGMRPEGDPASK